MARLKPAPVRPKHCATCPFHDAGWVQLRDFLTHRALEDRSPLCHQSGPGALKKGPQWLPKPHICRGARDLQLQVFHRFGMIDAPTDEAWQAAVDKLNAERP